MTSVRSVRDGETMQCNAEGENGANLTQTLEEFQCKAINMQQTFTLKEFLPAKYTGYKEWGHERSTKCPITPAIPQTKIQYTQRPTVFQLSCTERSDWKMNCKYAPVKSFKKEREK